MVALALTLLAHGFGIVGAFQPHRQAIGKEPCALWADPYIFLLKLFDVEIFKGIGSFPSVMVLPTEDRHEFQQRPDIRLFFPRNLLS